ncbi:putative leucine-rich repeat receptor-like serine/threonine-protein kinase [Cucumis melo var. makuwa]|uniref:non-specific serine/threonine protein kinase n=1 Tax=Cucumis melo var. makuwa TaxID=1194695 RepID=A0A5D3DX24_CUCMM|nr:putative leucine-rich repeat receptor-like serine/threonine-protein kinase [Cucumis melo var. makuwa]TYK27875.1 putative leucine-rich repeat receptor-like serine/threonine-protein kinase [Cucumis melo var. makuwa]
MSRVVEILPCQLFRLPYLGFLDLSWNYLSGEIPRELGFTKLKELYHFSLSCIMNLEANHLSGRLPSTLGYLVNLEIFVINDNNFEGQIPSSIKNWLNVTSIRVQGSGLSGLLPSEIGLLTKLTKLLVCTLISWFSSFFDFTLVLSRRIISDLNGASSPFPPLANLYNMEYLILRSCNIMDVLPSYLDVMGNLTILDLSFNKISGQIPSYFYSLARVENIFLTGNLLNGSVPEWMLETGNNIDLSYNKFEALLSNGCQSRLTIPIFKLCNRQEFVSFWFLQYSYSLHINCGGKEVTISGTTFEGDVDPGEPSVFVSSKTNWGFSNTGLFLYDTGVSVDYIELNHSLNFPTPYSELYESARVSPISLTYYAYCLGNGNYRISLHFSEIVLTNDTKLGGHGRRVFNIYIQGKLVVKDFNIVDAAGGILKPVIKRIPVAVTSNTVEIRFYWAGKGTFLTIENNTGYGPLISAISIELGRLVAI